MSEVHDDLDGPKSPRNGSHFPSFADQNSSHVAAADGDAVLSDVTDAELESLLTDLERFNDDQASVVVPLATLSEAAIHAQTANATGSNTTTEAGRVRPLYLASDLPPLPSADSRKIDIAPSPDDQGAAAASASFRMESRQNSGSAKSTPQQISQRIALLSHLAESTQGTVRAGLWIAAAELCEQVGEITEARVLYRRALQASPLDIVALRALRRDAITRRAWTEAAQLLEAEASLPLNAEERALALTLLAELQWQRLDNKDAAIVCLRQALALRPQSVSAAILLINLYASTNQEALAHTVMQETSYHWSDDSARAALLTECGRFSERNGDAKSARKHYEAALSFRPRSLDLLLALVRTGRGTGDINRAIEALHSAASLATDEVKSSLKWLEGRWLYLVAARPKDALVAVQASAHPLALRAIADILLAKGDLEQGSAALQAWGKVSGSTERALALSELALICLKNGHGEVSALLKEAALADGAVGTIRAARELWSRRDGTPNEPLAENHVSSAQDVEPYAAIWQAAQFIRDPRGLSEELHWLKRAAQDDEDALCADVLLLDVACSMRDEQNIAIGLENQALRAPPQRRIGVLLALSELAARSGDHRRAEAFLEQAREISHDQPVVLRPLGRLKHAKGPHVAAELWLKEAQGAQNERSAFAATMAARLFQDSGQAARAVDALRLALKVVPTYDPAVWSFERIAWGSGDHATLARVYEELAERATSHDKKLEYRLRSIIVHRHMQSSRAGKILLQTIDMTHDDPILSDMTVRHGNVPEQLQASLILNGVETYSALFARAVYLRALWKLEAEPVGVDAIAVLKRLNEVSPQNDALVLRIKDVVEPPGAALDRCLQELEHTHDGGTEVLLNRLATLEFGNFEISAAAIDKLQRIVERHPQHIPTLRTLHRYYTSSGESDREIGILERLTHAISARVDQAALARCAVRLLLAPNSARAAAADRLLLRLPLAAFGDAWIARRAGATAIYTKHLELSALAYQHSASLLFHPLERASLSLRAALLVERTTDSAQAARYLEQALPADTTHPTAFEELARICMQAREAKPAARGYESAAKLSRVPQHALALWHRAGVLWHDEVGDQPSAIEALERAAQIDISYLDVFDRLRRLLDDHGELKDLAELTRTRLSAGGQPKTLVVLHVQLADLYRRLGKPLEAKQQLEIALQLEPDHLDALRALGELSLGREEWKDAADAYIRIARLSRDHDELHRVFFSLGDIYDQHIPDLQRSEAAFRRVIKLAPSDMIATQRLADIYMREEDLDRAIETFRKLTEMDLDPDRNRQHHLHLAQAFERKGSIREAEYTLELARKHSPADLVVMEALAQFYERQQAKSAYAMHLNRATDDFRQAIRNDLSDAAAWHGLVRVLTRRGREDAAKACASAALASGVVDIDLSRLLSAEGTALITPAPPFPENLEALLAPAMLSPSVRTVFALTKEAMEKLFPIDLGTFRARRLKKRTPLIVAAQTVSTWLKLKTAHIYVTDSVSRMCVPLLDSPPTVLISEDLLTASTTEEQLFLMARALKMVNDSLTMTVRASPYDIAVALAAVIHCAEREFYPPGIEASVLVDFARQLQKHISKRTLNELAPHARIVASMRDFDPGALGAMALELGSRYALAVTGSAPAAVTALLKLNGVTEPRGNLAMRVEGIRRFPEISSLLNFAISEEHFEARRRIANLGEA